MMRQGLLFGSALALLSPACGGSSSETPPPLEPDSRGTHYVSAPLPRAGDAAASAPSPALADDDDIKPKNPARSTWGSPKPK